MKPTVIPILKTLCALILSMPVCNGKEGPKPISPANGIVTADNMPILSWQALEGARYEVWIDGIKLGENIPENWFIPFPLSYGEHEWKAVAVKGGSRSEGESNEFRIEGKPLSRVPDNAVLLRENWKVVSSLTAGASGSSLSKEGVNTADWQSTSVPATVLSAMVRNGLYPNPYIGTNNMRIPDINDEFNDDYGLLQYSHIKGKNPWKEPYWYRTEFQVPENYIGKKIWLNLGEINYRAEVWLNGEQIADTSQVVGMEQTFRFDISSKIKHQGKNALAVSIYPPDHPGKPDKEPLTPLAAPGTNMADGVISQDYTKWDVMGWDWQPPVRDRDMGITEDVYINATELLGIDNLYVTSDLPLPGTGFADVAISADLINYSGQAKECTLKINVAKDGNVLQIEKSFSIGANDKLPVILKRDEFPQLRIMNPKLWWPLGYGEPELYELTLEALAGPEAPVSEKISFGIREVETYLESKRRVYKVNGQEIYCKGGNWVIDMMLNWTAKRYEDEIKMTKNANLNLLRIWGPTGVAPEPFYEAADRNGILLWQDFLNDFWGTFRNRPGFCPDKRLFEKATIAVVKKLRNHPSVVIWCGGNEGPNPFEKYIINKILPIYDGRDTKHYLKISNGDGLQGNGPYYTLEPGAYFTDRKLNGFNSEVGPSGVPVYESFRKFMPEMGESWMPGRFPINSFWAYHDANDWPDDDSRKFSSYDDITRNYYGPPDSTLIGVKEYIEKCQLVNYDVYRACLEAINSQLWENSSGILLWKSNSSWTSITWQVYDWYLQAHAGYYGAKKAAAPICFQFNRKSKKLEGLNATNKPIEKMGTKATLYNSLFEIIWQNTETVNIPRNSVIGLNDTIPVPNAVCYLKLEVWDQQGSLLSDNLYWLSSGNDFSSFDTLPEPELKIRWEKTAKSGQPNYKVSVTNSKKTIALLTELKLVDPVSGLEILPSYWSDNYFSLLPGESKTMEVTIGNDILTEGILLQYKAFNMGKAACVKAKI